MKVAVIPFYFDNCQIFAVIRFSSVRDYVDLRREIAYSELRVTPKDRPYISFPEGYLVLDAPLSAFPVTRLKAAMLTALDGFFSDTRTSHLLGTEAAFSAS